MTCPKLSIEVAKEMVEEQFPALEVKSIVPVKEGGDASTFEVNESIIFRFATSEEHSIRLVNESKIVNAIHNKVSIQIPKFTYVGEPSEKYWFHFLGHKKITGISGEKISPNSRYQDVIAKNLGEFLSTLHSCSLGEGFVETKELEDPELVFEKAYQYRESISDFLDQKQNTLVQFLTGNVTIPSIQKQSFVLSHADFKGEHILLSENGEKIVGIIDWTDICLTDRTVDFGGILIWSGRDFVESMLKYYALPTEDDFLDRILFYTRCHTLINLGERIAGQSDAPIDLLVNQLNRAFS